MCLVANLFILVQASCKHDGILVQQTVGEVVSFRGDHVDVPNIVLGVQATAGWLVDDRSSMFA